MTTLTQTSAARGASSFCTQAAPRAPIRAPKTKMTRLTQTSAARGADEHDRQAAEHRDGADFAVDRLGDDRAQAEHDEQQEQRWRARPPIGVGAARRGAAHRANQSTATVSVSAHS